MTATWDDPTPIPLSSDPNNPDEWGQLRTNELREPPGTGWLDVSTMLAAGYAALNFGAWVRRRSDMVHLDMSVAKESGAGGFALTDFAPGFRASGSQVITVPVADSGTSTSWPTDDPWPETLPGG